MVFIIVLKLGFNKMLIRIEPWTPARLPNTHVFISMNEAATIMYWKIYGRNMQIKLISPGKVLDRKVEFKLTLVIERFGDYADF